MKKLGICVISQNALDHCLGLADAAKRLGIYTDIFLTGEGVKITQDKKFSKLVQNSGRLGICEVSFTDFGFKKKSIKVLIDRDFVTQMRNAELVEHCDRYLVL